MDLPSQKNGRGGGGERGEEEGNSWRGAERSTLANCGAVRVSLANVMGHKLATLIGKMRFNPAVGVKILGFLGMEFGGLFFWGEGEGEGWGGLGGREGGREGRETGERERWWERRGFGEFRCLGGQGRVCVLGFKFQVSSLDCLG